MQKISQGYDQNVRPFIDRIPSCPPQIKYACNLIITIALEIFCLIISGPIALLGLSHHFTYCGLNPKSLKGNHAILFLHGDNPRNQASFLPLAFSMMRAGFDNLFSVNINYNSEDTYHTDTEINRKIFEIWHIRENTEQPLTLSIVGHSQGALHAVNFALFKTLSINRNQVIINKIVTIASRQKVTESRFRACSKKIAWLSYRTEDALSKNHNTKVYNLVPANDCDWLVPQEGSNVIKDDEYHHFVSWTSHMSILFSPTTHARVIKFLR